MYFLNLTLGQVLLVFGSVSALAVALYLLDRSRRKLVVSTLRFWNAAERPAAAARRRRINQPWSLALQLASMALILLAIAQMRLGTQEAAPRDHVVILDTSAWMGARAGGRSLMEAAVERARAYVRALPGRDRVMVVRADAMTTPVTAFEPDRRKVEAAIAASTPGAAALNIDQAMAFARSLQQQGGRRIGEIAFIGAGRVAARDAGADQQAVRNLRVIPIADSSENLGLRKVGARRSAVDPDLWHIYAAVRNYGANPRQAVLAAEFGLPGAGPGRVPIGARRLTVPPGGEAEAVFEHRTRAAGVLSVALAGRDVFAADDQAEIELPAQPALTVTVYSSDPDLLRPVLGASRRLQAVYRAPSQYRPDDQGLVILDRFAPPQRPAADSIWIDPPAAGSPAPVRARLTGVEFARWHPDHPTAAGLRARDFKLAATSVFDTSPDDVKVGEVAAGPVVVARQTRPKAAVLGFHPALAGMRYELSTPLLFANLMRWASPEIFRRWELAGGSIGASRLSLDPDVQTDAIKVTHGDGSPLPFTVRDRALQFFSGTPGMVRVTAGDREWGYSLTLPEMWESRWEPAGEVRRGVPRFSPARAAAAELWPWLALAGGVGLLAEWLLFGSFRRSRAASFPALYFLRRKARKEAAR